MITPLISICAAAHRIENWEKFYKSIISHIPFEVVFVTNRKPGKGNPNIDLPDNFRWIYSTVKPAQCYEIAFRNATGKLLIWTSDHALFSPYALDNAYKLYSSKNNYKTLIAFRNVEGDNNIQVETTNNHFFHNHRVMPFGMISKQFLKELGGYDKSFICGQSENDVVLRAYNSGAQMFVCDSAIVYSSYERHNKQFNFRGPMYMYEKEIMNKLWVRNNKFNNERTVPFSPYSDKDILTISQGNAGLPNIYERTYIWK